MNSRAESEEISPLSEDEPPPVFAFANPQNFSKFIFCDSVFRSKKEVRGS